MKPLKPGNQNHRGLREFFAGRKLHRFQAEKIGIHALPSFISSLESMGLKFDRKLIAVPSNWGADAHVTVYWLAPESYRLAAELLGLDPKNHPVEMEAAGTAYLRASGG